MRNKKYFQRCLVFISWECFWWGIKRNYLSRARSSIIGFDNCFLLGWTTRCREGCLRYLYVCFFSFSIKYLKVDPKSSCRWAKTRCIPWSTTQRSLLQAQTRRFLPIIVFPEYFVLSIEIFFQVYVFMSSEPSSDVFPSELTSKYTVSYNWHKMHLITVINQSGWTDDNSISSALHRFWTKFGSFSLWVIRVSLTWRYKDIFLSGPMCLIYHC